MFVNVVKASGMRVFPIFREGQYAHPSGSIGLCDLAQHRMYNPSAMELHIIMVKILIDVLNGGSDIFANLGELLL